MRTSTKWGVFFGLASVAFVATAASSISAAKPSNDPQLANVRAMLEQLVAADTTNPPGNEARAVAIGAARLDRAGGLKYEITEFAPGRQNLVVRLKGNGKSRPLLILAHTDVVSAAGQPWTVEPHKVTEKDGFLMGRGTGDDLSYAAAALEMLIQLRDSGQVFNRDIIVAWTGGEEKGGEGVKYLLANHPEQLDAEIALNEGGSVIVDEETFKPKFVGVEAAQKVLQNFEISTTGDTGHSSRPYGRNAIAELSAAVDRLARAPFPIHLTPVTRSHFLARAGLESPEIGQAMREIAESQNSFPPRALEIVSRVPILINSLRTTCVPTIVSGGNADNALPATATTTVNCRIMPDESIESVHQHLIAAVADPLVTVKIGRGRGNSPASPLDGKFMAALKKVTDEHLGGLPIIPTMALGATDSCFLRTAGVHAYGIGPVFRRESDNLRSHGADERITISGLRDGYEFFRQLVIEIANQ